MMNFYEQKNRFLKNLFNIYLEFDYEKNSYQDMLYVNSLVLNQQKIFHLRRIMKGLENYPLDDNYFEQVFNEISDSVKKKSFYQIMVMTVTRIAKELSK